MTTDATPERHSGDSGSEQRSLKQRHMTMISLGGVIGAGLFVGSGVVMNETGQAAGPPGRAAGPDRRG